MAQNNIGFVPKRYLQPDYYKCPFQNWEAIYIADNDKEFILHANVHRRSIDRAGKHIESFDILTQNPDHRSVLREGVKTFKEAFSIIERLLENNAIS
jgi:hypothetical protein